MFALVTGASSGIGAELSKLLCREGWEVLGVARREEGLKALREELGKCFSWFKADLSREEGVGMLARYVTENYSSLDLLVNNAGFGLGKKLVDHKPEELREVFEVNAIAPVDLTLRLLKVLKEGSVVVFVITAGIYILMDDLPSYGASKAALHYMTLVLSKELRGRGIHVVRVYPGAIATEFFRVAGVEPGTPLTPPSKVAEAILKAVKSRKNSVFTPGYVKIVKYMKLLNPLSE